MTLTKLSSRAAPHIQQFIMSIISKRAFNEAHLPPTVSIVCTNNPDNGEYFVTARDEAQVTRAINLIYNPKPHIFIEQLDAQDVDPRIGNFWIASPEEREYKFIEQPKPIVNDRLRMIFNHLFPYIIDDPDLFSFVARNTFGIGFQAKFNQFFENDPPIDPKTILDNSFNERTIDKWVNQGRNGHIAASVYRLKKHLESLTKITPDEWAGVSRFVMALPKDSGASVVKDLVSSETELGKRFQFRVATDKSINTRYTDYLGNVNAQLTA